MQLHMHMYKHGLSGLWKLSGCLFYVFVVSAKLLFYVSDNASVVFLYYVAACRLSGQRGAAPTS